jgi:hypothetical protein
MLIDAVLVLAVAVWAARSTRTPSAAPQRELVDAH